MRLREIGELIDNTADPAFAVEGTGGIAAWNSAAETLFARPARDAIGRHCNEVIQGKDECGPVCSAHCPIQQSGRARHPVGNFDLLVQTADGPRWCNASVLFANGESPAARYSIHILRQIDVRKRLEMLMLELLARDFAPTGARLPTRQARALASSAHSPHRDTDLSARECEVLKLLGNGETTAAVGQQLNISRNTVNNHVQHILRKLDAHTRLEAFHRAEHAGLI